MYMHPSHTSGPVPVDECGVTDVKPKAMLAQTSLSQAAFAVQFQDSARMLWCIAASVLGRRSQVEDVLQEAAVIALNKLDQFDPDTNFKAWMGQIVRFVALNHARKTVRVKANPVDQENMREHAEFASVGQPAEAVTSTGELIGDQASFDDRVLASLNELEATARSCLLLRIIMEKSYHEISLALDIPEGTAMSHVHRARRTMRRLLSESNETPHDQELGDD